MLKVDEHTVANLDVVLQQVCKNQSSVGGDHESRKYIAKRLMQTARKGNHTLGGLEVVGRRALMELSGRKSI